MAQKNSNSKAAQSLVDYVTELKRLNQIDPKIPKKQIDQVLENPDQYALDFIEFEFVKNLPKFIEAYKLGKKLSKDLDNA